MLSPARKLCRTWAEKKQRQEQMPGNRQSHVLYVLREIKLIACQCNVSMEKCISVPHGRKTFLCFPSHEKKNILTEEGSEKQFTSTMKIPAPPLLRKWLLPTEGQGYIFVYC